jgi:hypothetical protein
VKKIIFPRMVQAKNFQDFFYYYYLYFFLNRVKRDKKKEKRSSFSVFRFPSNLEHLSRRFDGQS